MTQNTRLVFTMALIMTLVLIISLLAPVLANGKTQGLDRYARSDSIQDKEITSFQGVKYTAEFNKHAGSIHVTANNTNQDKIEDTGFVITVDEQRLYDSYFSISSKENQSWAVNITSGIDVLRNNHTVTVSTFGDSAQFNFTKEVNSSNSSTVPTPYIEDVEVTNGTIDGEPSAVAKVTVANPSTHPYSLKLMVHTQDTDGSFYPASVRPGTNRTITVELLDERGSQIAGEARLYAGNLSQGDGAMDQVGFVGRAGEDTNKWNETYEPIKGPWRSNGYKYHNETLADDTSMTERLSGGYDVFGIPAVYVVVGLGVLFGVFRWKR